MILVDGYFKLQVTIPPAAASVCLRRSTVVSTEPTDSLGEIRVSGSELCTASFVVEMNSDWSGGLNRFAMGLAYTETPTELCRNGN